MVALRLLLPLAVLLALACGVSTASPTECARACGELPSASFVRAPLASSDSPSLVPLAESLGLCALGLVGVAAGVLLARRA